VRHLLKSHLDHGLLNNEHECIEPRSGQTPATSAPCVQCSDQIVTSSAVNLVKFFAILLGVQSSSCHAPEGGDAA
jgi:hypothetical protein